MNAATLTFEICERKGYEDFELVEKSCRCSVFQLRGVQVQFNSMYDEQDEPMNETIKFASYAQKELP